MSIGQTANTLKTKVVKEEVENYLSEKHYTRIPNKDFDKVLQHAVEEEVKSSIIYWVTLISIITAVFGSVVTYAFNIKIKQVVQAEIENKNKNILKSLDKMMIESKMNKLRMDFEVLKEKYQLNPKLGTNKPDAYGLLHEAVKIKLTDLVPEIINHIGFILFSQRHIEEFERLINDYEKKYELKVTTYMNAAILCVDLYDLEGTQKFKDNCIKYCLASINQTSWYGEPRGILILLYAMDFVKAETATEGEASKENVKAIIADILKGSSNYIATNTCKRLDRDKKDKVFVKYLSAIEAAMPDEFNKLYAKAMSETQRDDLKSI